MQKTHWTIATIFIFFTLSCVSQKSTVIKDLSHEVQIYLMAKTICKQNDVALTKIKTLHEKYEIELCKTNENKGNTLINSFHSSYVSLYRKIDKMRHSTGKLTWKNMRPYFITEQKISELIIEFLSKQSYILQSDHDLEKSPYSNFTSELQSKMEQFNKIRKDVFSKFESSRINIEPQINCEDYLPELPSTPSATPSMNGSDFNTLNNILNQSKEKYNEEFQKKLPEINTIKENIRNIDNSTFIPDSIISSSNSDSLNTCKSNTTWTPKKELNSLSHLRLVDRFSISTLLRNTNSYQLSYLNSLIQVDFQWTKQISSYCSFKTDAPFSIGFDLNDEFINVQKKQKFNLMKFNSIGCTFNPSQSLGIFGDYTFFNSQFNYDWKKGIGFGVRILSKSKNNKVVTNLLCRPFNTNSIEISTGIKF